MILVIITALIPALILGWWIYKKDSLRPEPLRMLYKAFLYGVGSTFVTLVITSFMSMAGLMVYDLGSFKGAVSTALLAAALPEEISKLLMLWLFLRNNPYYDEYLDGIVYAACVGLGFAATENIMYLLQSSDWVGTGIVRGLTAVPAHFAIACVMGYFYSKRNFGDRTTLTAVCVLAVPVIIHWVYDALAFSEGIYPALSVFINALFVLLIWLVYRGTMRRINTMHQLDHARMSPPPLPPAPGTPTLPTTPGTPPPFSDGNDKNNTPLA